MTLEQIMRWAENWRLILALWPDWAPTDAQTELWNKRLNECAQCRLKDAIETVATSLSGRSPRLSAILKVYEDSGRIAVARSVLAPTVVPDSLIEQDKIDMRLELEELDHDALLSHLRSAAPLVIVPLCGAIGTETAGLQISAARKVIDEYENKCLRDWPPMLVGFVWADMQEDLPF